MAELKPINKVNSAESTGPIKYTAGSITKKKVKAYCLADDEFDWFKIMAFGIPGVGKTFGINAFLKMGMKVVVLSSDIGGNGLRTVKAQLKKEGKEDLLKNLYWVDVDYETFKDFLNDPTILDIGGGDIYAFDPDMVVWEGMSTWQMTHLSEFLSASDQEIEDKYQHYNIVLRGSTWTLDKFVTMHGKNDKKWHKYVTFHESAPREDKISGENLRGPLLQGSFRSIVAGAFDLVIQMKKKDDKEFEYICNSSKTLSKVRGLPLEAKEPADMEKLWKKITGKTATTIPA